MRINANITPRALVMQMTAFAYERHYAFQAGEIDAAIISTTEQIRVGTSVEDIQDIYDEKSISLRASRTTSDTARKLVIPPDLFIIKYQEKTHLPSLPPAIGPYLPPETVASYTNCFYGELHQLHAVEYTVQKEGDDIDISRNVSYALHDSTGALYEIDEIDETRDKVQWIPLTHEQSSLRVERRILEEQAEDQVEQLIYNEDFDSFRDGLGNADFYADFVDMRAKEATLCISSLIHCVKRGSRIPRYEELIDLA